MDQLPISYPAARCISINCTLVAVMPVVGKRDANLRFGRTHRTELGQDKKGKQINSPI